VTEEIRGKLAERISKVTSQVSPLLSEQIAEQLEMLEASQVAPGLATGEQAPDFSLPNRRNQPVSLADRLQEGPVVLSFLRGAWCPICQLELQALAEVDPEVRSLGAHIIAVSPQSVERNVEFGQTHDVAFDLLSDADQQVNRIYKLHFRFPELLRDIYVKSFELDLSNLNADNSWELPVPATYVIDSDGLVFARFVEMNYLRRMEPEDILLQLRKLG
jgi:peroxiredoxin